MLAASIIIGTVVLWLAWWWLVGRNVPVVQPLHTADDDPLMLDALEKARCSIPEMRSLFAESPQHMRVKIPFVASSGTTEYLWSELLKIEGEEMEVRYITPPATHTGRLERIHRHSVTELRDWVFTKDESNYRGGFSMRAMFVRGRELWGDLPPKVKAEEQKYAGAGT